MMDAIATEPQFLDHIAPVWRALPEPIRGRFLVDAALVDRARCRGVEPTAIDANGIRMAAAQQPPRVDGTPCLVASIGDIKVGRRLTYGPFAFIEHGAGQSYGAANAAAASYAGGPDRSDNELIMAPSESCAQLWRAAYPSARVEVVGCPRLDDLPRREFGPGPVIALSFHGDWPRVAYGGTALGEYLPMLGVIGQRFTTIGHAHPGKGWGKRMARLYARAGIPFVADFDDVCRQADLYVCDNSSTIPEFASTGRPVVLLNARIWSRKGGVGGRFWDWAHIGVNVDRPEGLIAGIEEALADGSELRAAREDALELVYQPRSGGAALAADAIAGWLATREAVAA